MNTQTTQSGPAESFEATIQFSASAEKFKANRVTIESTTSTSGVACWTIKAFEDTRDKKDGTTEINTIRIHIEKGLPSADIQLAPALSPPAMRENSAGYYKLKDSPDDDDDEVDTAHEFPGVKGDLFYLWTANEARLFGKFNLKVNNPDNTTFDIKGAFNICNNGLHVI